MLLVKTGDENDDNNDDEGDDDDTDDNCFDEETVLKTSTSKLNVIAILQTGYQKSHNIFLVIVISSIIISIKTIIIEIVKSLLLHYSGRGGFSDGFSI